MHLHRGVSILAAAAIMGSGVPAASAHQISTGTGGGTAAGPVVVSSQPATDSGTEWALIGVSAAGGAILTAAGMTASRRYGHGTPQRSTATMS